MNKKFAVLAVVPVLALSTFALKAQQKPVMVHAPLIGANVVPTGDTVDGPTSDEKIVCCTPDGCHTVSTGTVATCD